MERQWVFWIFCVVTLGAALGSLFSRSGRSNALCVWLAGWGTGGVFLTLGTEYLAVITWLVTTIVTGVLLFFVSLLGDDEEKLRWDSFLPALISGSLLMVFLAKGFFVVGSRSFDVIRSDLSQLGSELVHHRLVIIEVVSLTLFLAIIGVGVLSRPEAGEQKWK